MNTEKLFHKKTYNFQKHLLPGEKILYQDVTYPGKGDNSIVGEIFLILFCFFCYFLMIWGLITETGDGANGISLSFIAVSGILTVFNAIGISSILDKLFFKKRRIADNFYCLTNLRAIKYESKKDKISFGYLANYDLINCINLKNKFGDLYMTIDLDKKFKQDQIENSQQQLIFLKDIFKNPNPNNLPTMVFESISNPRQVAAIAKNAKKNAPQTAPKDFILKSQVL